MGFTVEVEEEVKESGKQFYAIEEGEGIVSREAERIPLFLLDQVDEVIRSQGLTLVGPIMLVCLGLALFGVGFGVWQSIRPVTCNDLGIVYQVPQKGVWFGFFAKLGISSLFIAIVLSRIVDYRLSYHRNRANTCQDDLRATQRKLEQSEEKRELLYLAETTQRQYRGFAESRAKQYRQERDIALDSLAAIHEVDRCSLNSYKARELAILYLNECGLNHKQIELQVYGHSGGNAYDGVEKVLSEKRDADGVARVLS